jgi:hypothetical protein
VEKDQEKKWNPAKESQYSDKDEKSSEMKIQPGMEVFAKGATNDNSKKAIATVDHKDGDSFIKLTKSDSKDGKHHWIPTSWVERVDSKGVYLNKSEEEFTRGLQNELPKNAESGRHSDKEKMAM